MKDTGTLTIGARTNVHFHYKVFDDLGFMLYEPLLRYRPRTDGKSVVRATLDDLVPRLITGWEVSEGGYQYVVKIRPGVKSSRGNSLTAEDVKWSWDRALLARRQGRFTARIAPLKDEKAVEVVDEHTVRFTLERPNVTFPHFLTSKYIHIYDATECRRHVTKADPWVEEWLANDSAGFGPFTVESYDADRDIATYVANPHYFFRDRQKIKRIRRLGIKSMDERVRRFRSGELDMVTSLSGEEFLSLAAKGNTSGIKVHGHDPLLLQMNCLRPPFDRVEVRQAISYAVPYREIYADIWKGLHRWMRSPFVDACAGYTEAYFDYSHDPDKARDLLRRANLDGEVKASLMICSEFSPHIRPTAEAIATALARIGFRIAIEDVDEHALRTAGFNHAFDLMIDPHIHMIADDYYISQCDYGDAKWGVENLNQYFNDELFALQAQCMSATSEQERIAFAHRMQKTILEGAPQAFLLQLNTLIVTGPHVEGLAWDANGRIHFHEMSKTAPAA